MPDAIIEQQYYKTQIYMAILKKNIFTSQISRKNITIVFGHMFGHCKIV